MKQADISIGMIVGIGASHRRNFIYAGVKGRVVEKGVFDGKWSKRADSIRVVIVDDEGKDVLVEDTERNRRFKPDEIGKPRMRVVKARNVERIAVILAQQEEERKIAEERERKANIAKAARDQAWALLVDMFDLDGQKVEVRARYAAATETETDFGEIHTITLTDDAARKLLAIAAQMNEGSAIFEAVEQVEADKKFSFPPTGEIR